MQIIIFRVKCQCIHKIHKKQQHISLNTKSMPGGQYRTQDTRLVSWAVWWLSGLSMDIAYCILHIAYWMKDIVMMDGLAIRLGYWGWGRISSTGAEQERGQGQCLDVWRAPKWPIMVILWVNNDDDVNITSLRQWQFEEPYRQSLPLPKPLLGPVGGSYHLIDNLNL